MGNNSSTGLGGEVTYGQGDIAPFQEFEFEHENSESFGSNEVRSNFLESYTSTGTVCRVAESRAIEVIKNIETPKMLMCAEWVNDIFLSFVIRS